jgi:class 3 adenylate cyclase
LRETNALVTKILELSHEDPNFLQSLERFRRPVTVMFTDIKGTTAYFENFGDVAGLAMVRECNDLLQHVIDDHRGRVIETVGDTVMAIFDDCDESIRAAITMQRRLRQANATAKSDDETLVSVGLHHGLGIVTSDRVIGDVVNVASRVESIAGPRQIVISDCLERQISRSQFDVALLGRFHLKGKREERDLFEVRWGDTEMTPVVAHTIIKRSCTRNLMLQCLTGNGKVIASYPFTPQGVTIGRTEGDLKFPADAKMSATHARLALEQGQPIIEDLSDGGSIFIRLIATYALEQGDVIIMGRRLFRFLSNPDLVAAATAMGRKLSDVSELLNQAAAEFFVINAEGEEKYSLRQEEVRFGRTDGTYIFQDDPLMSRSHARVYHRGADFFIEDLRTLNGTFVKVRGRAPVPFGTMILVGRQIFRIVPP